MLALFAFGGLFILAGLFGFFFAPFISMQMLGVNAPQSALATQTTTGQIVSGVIGFVGLVLVIIGNYIRRGH